MMHSMHPRPLSALSALLVASLAPPAFGDTCRAEVTVDGKKATLAHCAVAVYDNAGVTLWLTEQPIAADERSTFQLNSYPRDTDADGNARTMMHLGFCPGGGAAQASAAAVGSVELSLAHASSAMLQRQWVAELPADGWLKIERLTGTLAAGGKLAGRITGKAPDAPSYTWTVEFDLTLPDQGAAAGPGCGG